MSPSPVARLLSCSSSAPISVAAWNAAIKAAVDGGRCLVALHVYVRMRRAGAPPDNLTFPFVLKACARLSDARTGQAAHALVHKSPFLPDVFVQTALIDMYQKCGQTERSCYLFDRMQTPDLAAWNVMMAGQIQSGCLRIVLDHFSKMRMDDVMPDSITFLLLTRACAVKGSLHAVKSIHSLGIQSGVGTDVTVANAWISAYSKCGDLYSAELVFGGLPLSDRTIVSWNSMIAGYTLLGKLNKAIACFREMFRHGTKPDSSTCVSLLSLFAHTTALLEGIVLHSFVIKGGLDSDASVGNALISLCSKCGAVDLARFHFDSMLIKTCVSWTALISGYALKGDINGAMNIFHNMQTAGEKPDCATIITVLSACGQIGAVAIGRLINQYAVENGFGEEIKVCNALLDMYMKCGSSIEAQQLFDRMPQRTIISWTTMISGYAMNGACMNALYFFSQTVEAGIDPNHITFLAALQACSHGGLLEEGLKYYGMMTEVYKMHPGLEHYACMVDLLGRKGHVRKAVELVKSMPMEPDAVVWGALLGACITHHEIEIGEYAARHLFEMEPQTAVSYVSMANIYASRGRWDGVVKVRSMMREQRTKKSPGQSSVHMDCRLHVFSVEDTDHPEIFYVYQLLDRLYLHMTKTDSKESS